MLRELCVRLAPFRPLNTLLRATQYATEHFQLDSERGTLLNPPGALSGPLCAPSSPAAARLSPA